MDTQLEEQSTAAALLSHPGKDEMNFAEFPIALLTDRVPKGQTTIRFEDLIYDERRKKMITRKRVIEGSEEYGLPTATDDLVILALIQLTKLRGDFRQREVTFSRLELIKLLGWPDEGRSYDRIKLSLLRITNVTYNYDNAWWDPRQKSWTTKAFHIIDTVEINDSRTASGQGGLFPSRIVWNDVIFDSFQAGFLRNIDFQLCMRLEHPIALRLYRFMGKRFHVKSEWVFDLRELAYDHVGLGRNYEGGTQIARKLKPAIAELEKTGFLERLSDNERFIKKGRDWSIVLRQKFFAPLPAPTLPVGDTTTVSPCLAALEQRGVGHSKAVELVKQHPAKFIEAKCDIFDWLTETNDTRIARSPAGYLVKSIQDDYAAPKGFLSKAERQKREAAKQEADRKVAADRCRMREEEQRQEKERQATDAYLRRLTPAGRTKLEAEVLAQADPETRQTYEDSSSRMFRDTLMLSMLREYLAQKRKPATTGA